jgi:AraC-like DNA-binding protein
MPYSKYSKAEREAVIQRKHQLLTQLFNEGKTDAEIAEGLTAAGFPREVASIPKMRTKIGLKRPHAMPSFMPPGGPMDTEFVVREFTGRNPQTRDEITRVIQGIAQEVNRHPEHVRRFLRGEGLVASQHREIPQEQLDRAKALLEEGLPYSRVSAEVGLTRDQLTRRFPGRGIRTGVEMSEYRQALKLEQKLGL